MNNSGAIAFLGTTPSRGDEIYVASGGAIQRVIGIGDTVIMPGCSDTRTVNGFNSETFMPLFMNDSGDIVFGESGLFASRIVAPALFSGGTLTDLGGCELDQLLQDLIGGNIGRNFEIAFKAPIAINNSGSILLGVGTFERSTNQLRGWFFLIIGGELTLFRRSA